MPSAPKRRWGYRIDKAIAASTLLGPTHELDYEIETLVRSPGGHSISAPVPCPYGGEPDPEDDDGWQ